jgi:hypothetical protein
MTQTLDAAVTDALNRLGDLANKVWSRSELELYFRDGYDTFCRRSKCLFDIYVIENLPPTGNWQTDLEKYLAEQIPGMGLSDSPFHFTNDFERNYGVDGRYGGSYSGPAGTTLQLESTILADGDGIPSAVQGGPLPQSTVEVLRVTYNDRELYALGSAQARRLDPNYESRSGDPQFFTFDKDGIFFLRLIPNAQGDAVYDTVSGSWGTMTYTDDTDVSVVTTEVSGYNTGGYGILRHRDDMFPTNGPWGTPTRVHPTDANVKVEVYRLGRDLGNHPFELPDSYLRYPLYYAMSQALRRDGPGQDMELADHFEQRFEMGIHRMVSKRSKMDRERIGRLTGAPTSGPFGNMGWPQAPFPYENRW